MNLTARIKGHPGGFSQETHDKRDELVRKISKEYAYEKFINLELQTGLLDTYPLFELVSSIDAVISELKPDWIFIPNRSDVHSDHRVAFQAIYSCTKNFRMPYIKKIMMYETLSETEFTPAMTENAFVPNCFVDVTAFLERKLEILKLYETEIMQDPLPRSIHAIKGLSAYRGSRIGVHHAEAFMLLFEKN